MRVLTGLGKLLVAALVAGVLVAGLLLPSSIGIGLAANKAADAIESAPSDPMNLPMPQRTTITDNTGKPITYLYQQNRVVVPLSSISRYLQLAVISIEDRRFLEHRGVDWRGMVRALLKNSGDNGAVQGASTLTQQYVKNYLYLVEAKTEAEKADAIAQTPIRKLREAKLALNLENGPNARSKDQILEGYLNLVAFGPSTYGAEAASMAFFGVHASDLSLEQAALLAGMINNPNKYNPLDPDRIQDARDRRDLVLDSMVRTNAISAATATATKAKSIQLNPTSTSNGCVTKTAGINGFFCQYVLDYLLRAGFDQQKLSTGGYTIRSTMDPTAMARAKIAVDKQVNPADPRASRIANVMTLVEPGLGSRRILAMVSNRPYGLDASKGQTVLRLTTTFAPLGAGSTFKVFTAAAAMELGLGTNTIIPVPAQYTSPLVPTHPFNNAGSFPTSMSLSDALATSPNTAFVQLEDQIGLDKVTDMAVRLGMKGYLLDAGDVVPAFSGAGTDYAQQVIQQKIASFTLGVSPVSPLELANVGATIKSDGQWCPPSPVDSISDPDGKLVSWTQEPCAQAVEPDLARTLAVAMEGDISDENGTSHASAVATGWGTGSGAAWVGKTAAAGKTGTTQDYKSSAFLGFTAQYAGAVVTWDYQPRPQSMCKDPVTTCTNDVAQGGKGLSGGSIPASTWFTAVKDLQGSRTPTDFSPAVSKYIEGSAQTAVPYVVGLDISVATQQIEAKGFKVATVTSGSTGAPANQVVGQTPTDNTLPGTTVTLTVSTGGSTGG